MSGKTSRSFSVPEELDELMRDRSDVNWSGLVTTFLQEYAASGRGTEAAMVVRLEQVEQELAEARQEVDRLQNERDRIQAALNEKTEERREIFRSYEELQEQHPDPSILDASNEAVKTHAQKLGLTPEMFLAKYQEWSE